ncbi:glycosyltransferase 87 family protein [Corynebacterium sp. ES2794-CONJ1]|uniref:glycosyltransferase 87 family protein n=1 Tax=unclassified Corynebacterium TaxID=2624378 RepID=UPI002166F605|nr:MULTISPECIES: glycosyltransferase 87 family protein [unclassified Corynebacterium]MCS4489782.1 glycosyltransferase 87 family protein [Corynebacterium sp. ES2775-CONJ]MCS4491854.1 glycosyltransferase 87 family protein [Corynebacterium sp. ES2715-CONJ3]MCS4531959.1 glycosyltransferase 87 family protein [Corynebacterium sp. ES2730-CONJ]MCU9519360.1 glycosyltransferase 87 family protein [Corynebacterium sp. ES2794-CONJ1]
MTLLRRFRPLLTVVACVVSALIMVLQIADPHGHIDMIIYRQGAQAYMDGASLYQAGFPAYDLTLPFIYPPFAALLLSPFALLSEQHAGYLMIALSGLLLALCLWYLGRYLFSSPSAALLFTATGWGFGLLLEPVVQNAKFGQINMWLLALVFLDIVPRKRKIPRGWLIGIAAAIKITPAVMVLYLVLRKDLKGIGMFILGAVGATAIGALHNTKETVDFFGRAIFVMNDNSRIGVNIGYISNQSIKGVLTRLWPSSEAAHNASDTIQVLWLILAVLVTVIFAVVMLRLLRSGLDFEAALVNTALMLLVSPISWSHHWVWWPIWIAVLGYYALRLRARTLVVLLGAMSFFMMTTPPHWWLGDPQGDQDFEQILLLKLWMDDYFFWTLFLILPLLKTNVKGAAVSPAAPGVRT